MEISAFDVYLVMQIDEIKDAISWLGHVMSSISFIGLIASATVVLSAIEHNDTVISRIALCALALLLMSFVGGILLRVATGFVPSQQTLAAMKIVPSVARNDFVCKTIPTDAKQVYSLAADAIKKALEEGAK